MGKGNAQSSMKLGLPQVDYTAIVVDGNVDKTVEAAKAIGEAIRSVKSSQIRGIFATARQIQLKWDTDSKKAYRDAVLLRPRIAYSASRNDLQGLDGVLGEALKLVSGDNAKQRYLNFVDFFEAIVAYHKASGGRN
jgi:CRISPR-associated protein Csm2